MSGIIALLLSPDVSHVLYAAGGAALGWWALRHPSPGKPVAPAGAPVAPVAPVVSVPAELLDAVRLLIDRWLASQQVQAHGQLQSLSQPITTAVTAPGLGAPK